MVMAVQRERDTGQTWSGMADGVEGGTTEFISICGGNRLCLSLQNIQRFPHLQIVLLVCFVSRLFVLKLACTVS